MPYTALMTDAIAHRPLPATLLLRLDARVKVLLLVVFTASVFFVESPWALLGEAVALAALFALGRCQAREVLGLLPPVLAIALFSLAFNALGPSLSPTWDGFLRGSVLALRILVLALASILVTLTSASEALTAAIGWFLAPLRFVRVPVDDIAVTLGMAIRFIPLVADECRQVKQAQWSRGASFGEGPLPARLSASVAVMAPLLAGLFRHGTAVARAMDSRCYGACSRRSSLHVPRMRPADWAVLAAGVALCVGLAAAC